MYKYELILKDGLPALRKVSRVHHGQIIFSNPETVAKFFGFLKEKAEEFAYVLALDNTNKGIAFFEISHGSVNASILQPREVMIRLLLCGATSFIVIHNHPSGNTKPSKDDMRIYDCLLKAGEMMCLPLLDSIIVGNGFYSTRENK